MMTNERIKGFQNFKFFEAKKPNPPFLDFFLGKKKYFYWGTAFQTEK